MASVIPGYNYDIFISYRQKDNKYDGWVTEFVENLKKELEATFKEEISIYFDINPRDGLLESHSVDKSLESKLKCLIFIPIISQTYCDPNSYAWQHELCAFENITKGDKFGRDIKLASGNVSSRILPVKIHDLDPEDKILLENELGGVLRSIEFVYKSAGVNRPLRANEDHPQDNINKTYYRDQINKVANAVKEIIAALKKQSQHSEEVLKQDFEIKSTLQKNLRTKIIAGTFFALVLIAIGFFFIPRLFRSAKQLEKTIAVLPFRSLSNDTTQLYFCDGFMEEILNNLQKINSFTVRSRTSSEQYRDTKKSITTIGNELNVSYLIEGSVGWEGDSLKIWVQLIDSKSDKHVWSNEYIRESKQIFSLQSEIAKDIASGLKTLLSTEEKELIEKSQTTNLEAYNLYLQGRFFWYRRTEEDLKRSIECFEKSIAKDSKYALAYAGLADAYFVQTAWGWSPKDEGYAKGKIYALKAIDLDKNLSEAYATLGGLLYRGEWKWEEAKREFLISINLNPNYAFAHSYYSELLAFLRQNDLARIQINYALELEPFMPNMHRLSSIFYYYEGKFHESLAECLKWQELDNDNIRVYWMSFYNYVKLDSDLKAIESLQKILLLNTLTAENAIVVQNVYDKTGMKGIFNWLIELELKKTVPKSYDLATWYAILDKRQDALFWIEKAFEEHSKDIIRIYSNPDFDNLRSEPRFQKLITKMGLS